MDWSSTLKQLASEGGLDSSNIGLEREALRFTPNGQIAQSPHQKALALHYAIILLRQISPRLLLN